MSQEYLEGMAPPSIPSLDAAAKDYYDKMKARMRMAEDEADAKRTLMATMSENGLEEYTSKDGLTARISEVANVKVKPATAAAKQEDAEGDDADE